MNTIYSDLQNAFENRTLINVYQEDEDVFYTGYVNRINDDETLLSTYDSLGLADGMVCLKNSVITEVEFESDDLSDIKLRMSISEDDNFIDFYPNSLSFATNINLFEQIIIQSMLDKQVILVQDLSSNHFIEGLITHVSDNDFQIKNVDKFHFSNKKETKINFANIKLVEFQGRELTILSRCLDVFKRDSLPTIIKREHHDILDGLKFAYDNQQLVEIRSRYNKRYFYVGQIISLSDSQLVIKVVDMAGQFGGYVLMKNFAVHNLIVQSDYLFLIQKFIDMNKHYHMESQPVLNFEREFDSQDDLFLDIINQSKKLKYLIRLQLSNGNNFMGYPVNLDDENVYINQLDETKTFLILNKKITLTDIVELSFGYVDAYLVREILSLRGEI
ncbi:hypothetical protein [Apilactobacillus xinyiensis]|uniref:hypothetical protein n=1 Tax=Apilactobacillus xinyiensis TaxID=2841032 RepID=UPI001C7DB53B|nr:hypothetical protein [Apilactobacillus xinyiensis]